MCILGKEIKTKMKPFNIIIAGVGGLGAITLTKIIAQAAMINGYDVKTSELHGLSQKGGSVQTHIRFGDRIYSPLVPQGEADLIIGLEISETLRNISYANSETIVLSDTNQFFYQENLSVEELSKKIQTMFKGEKHLISASQICNKELKKQVLAGIYMLGHAIDKKIIPLKGQSVLKAILNNAPERYLELNKKAFSLSKKYD